MILSLLSAILPTIFSTVDKAVLDKDAAERLKSELNLALLSMSASQQKAAASIVLAEVQGASWLQRNWRPLLMMVCIAIIANNYLLTPYVAMFFNMDMSIELPDFLWNTMNIGIGGYTVSRGLEKISSNGGIAALRKGAGV